MKKVALLLSLVVFGGCFGHAVLVRRDQTGGTLTLRGERGKAMEDAHRQMAAHCGGGYTVVSEENVVVGQATETQARETYGQSSTQGASSSVTSNVTEYRITYVCGSGQGAPQAAPPPPPPPPAGQPGQ